jgi:hypothetical protein
LICLARLQRLQGSAMRRVVERLYTPDKLDSLAQA